MSTAERAPELAQSKGISYQELLDTDTHPVPEILREQSPPDLPPTFVPLGSLSVNINPFSASI